MKKIFLIVILLNIICNYSIAQKVELDAAIRHGQLDNGLSYYILHNEEPKERVSFYMIQKVGAILEEDNQNGLAHFLEHMAFNGTKHFPDKNMLTFLQSHGVAFGADINAYTATDETVYNLSDVPTANEEVMDSCLLILHDWSNYLSLTEDEINAERGVISEEWRTRRTAQFRMMKQQNEVLFEGSQYGKRDVIGDLDVIQNFKPETLHDYYKKWYRTDLQAVVIVGDIDVDKMEQKVKSLFSQIPAPVNPAERVYYDLPNNKDPRFVLATDKEASTNYIYLRFSQPAMPPADKDVSYLRSLFAKGLFLNLIQNRISEKLQEENPPFIVAQVFFQDHLPTASIAGVYIMHKPEDWKNALMEATSIIENVKDYGFTATELSRAKTQLLSEYEDAFKKRDKRSNNSYAMEIKDHFIKNEPTPGIERELQYLNDNLESISLEEVSAWSHRFLTDENALIAVSGPEEQEAAYPSKEDVVQVLQQVKTTTLKPFTDSYKERPLIENVPTPGKILKTKHIKEIDAKLLTLSNGVKVYVQHSDLEKEKVLFGAFSYGGKSLLNQDRLASAELMSDFIGSYGLGDFSAIELGKALTGKIVSFEMNIAELSEGISGSSTPQDLETLFQLLYLSFEQPRFDEQAYNALKLRYDNYAKNLSNDINQAFNDSVIVTLSNHHPRVLTFGESMINQLSFEGINEVYKQRFGNPGDFFFVFTGNFDESELLSHVNTYIASLDVNGKVEKFIDQGIRTPAKNTVNIFSKDMTVAKGTVYVSLSKKLKYTKERAVYMSIIGKLLDKRYLEEIREKEGGTYGVAVGGSFNDQPYDEARLRLKFDCSAENADKLKQIALNEIDSLINGKVIADDLDEIKSNLAKVRAEQIEKLGFWHGQLISYGKEGKLKMSNEEYLKLINQIEVKDVARQAKKLLADAVKVEIVMTPK